MTAFNPPSNLFFSGVTFNPNIIEGNTVSGGGDVTLAGNNTFTGVNSFTNATGIIVNNIDVASTAVSPIFIAKNFANEISLGSPTNPIPVIIAGTMNVYQECQEQLQIQLMLLLGM